MGSLNSLAGFPDEFAGMTVSAESLDFRLLASDVVICARCLEHRSTSEFSQWVALAECDFEPVTDNLDSQCRPPLRRLYFVPPHGR